MTPTDQTAPLTNVHDAIQAAILEASTEEMVNANFRLSPTIKQLSEMICDRHGVSLSQFLRKCCEGLVRDYGAFGA